MHREIIFIVLFVCRVSLFFSFNLAVGLMSRRKLFGRDIIGRAEKVTSNKKDPKGVSLFMDG
jgi:hypothetical protein